MSNTAPNTKSVPAIERWVDELVVEDYPYGRFTTEARFFIEEKKGRGQRAGRTTVNPKTGRTNKPKYTTYSVAVKIGVGTDGRTYILTGSPGQLGFTAGDMKYDAGDTLFTGDAEYAALAEVLGFNPKPGKVQAKRYPGGATINGLQGTTTTIREILQTAEMTPEEIEAIDKLKRKNTATHTEWAVTFKDGSPKFLIKVVT